MSSFFFYAGTLGFVCGIFVRSLYTIDMYALTCIAVVALALFLIGKRGTQTSPATLLIGTTLFLLLFCIGGFRMEYATQNDSSPTYDAQLDTKVILEGTVVREVERREKTTHLYIQVEDDLLLAFASPYTNANYGDKVQIEGTVKKPEPFETDLGRVFDYQNYLRARGVSYTLAFAQVEVIDSGLGNPIIAALLQFKHAFMKKVEQVLPQPEAGLGEGLLLGVKQALGEDLENAFRKTGITHIVVLSGYNVMLVIVFVMYMLSFVLPMRLRLLFGLLAVCAFALLVGLSATVVRASLMASLLLVAQSIGRTYAVVRALVVTGLVMLIINPYLLVYDVGFQLSFIATLGLILFAPHIEKYVHWMPKTIGLREFLTATVATQIFVAPILLYQIGELSIVSVVVNVLVLPMVPVAMLLTFITGMLAFVSLELATVVGFVATWSLSYILGIAQTFSQLPFASFSLPAFPFVITVMSYGVLAYLLWKLHTKSPMKRNEYVSWTIVDESELVQELQSKQIPKTDLPIFFR